MTRTYEVKLHGGYLVKISDVGEVIVNDDDGDLMLYTTDENDKDPLFAAKWADVVFIRQLSEEGEDRASEPV